MKCVVTGVERQENPEEWVRQAFARELMGKYGYRREDIRVELTIQMGSRKDKRADLAVFRPETPPAERTQHNAYILVECKRAGVSNSAFEAAIRQLETYMAACRNPRFGIVVAGDRRTSFQLVKQPDGHCDPVEVSDIPHASAPKQRFTVVGSSPPNSGSGHDQYSPHQHQPQPLSWPSRSSGRKFLPVVVLGGILATLVVGGTCVALRPWRSMPRSTTPESPAQTEPTSRQCSIASWDGAVRGWAKLGSVQCTQPGVKTGYYVRVVLSQDKAASQAAVAQAWRRYVGAYLAGGACPSATEMIFFNPTGEAGAGILFPQRPPSWDAVMQREPQWRLLDGGNQAMTTPVCFFPAEESRRPPGWSGSSRR